MKRSFSLNISLRLQRNRTTIQNMIHYPHYKKVKAAIIIKFGKKVSIQRTINNIFVRKIQISYSSTFNW